MELAQMLRWTSSLTTAWLPSVTACEPPRTSYRRRQPRRPPPGASSSTTSWSLSAGVAAACSQ